MFKMSCFGKYLQWLQRSMDECFLSLPPLAAISQVRPGQFFLFILFTVWAYSHCTVSHISDAPKKITACTETDWLYTCLTFMVSSKASLEFEEGTENLIS